MTIRCEICGSESILKQDGYYICQMCHVRYSLQELKEIFFQDNANIANVGFSEQRNDETIDGIQKSKPKHYTTKDLRVGEARYILISEHKRRIPEDPARGFYKGNTAYLFTEDSEKIYICGKYNYSRKRLGPEKGIETEYERIFGDEISTSTGIKYYQDGERGKYGYFGFKYNVLSCLIDFLYDLDRNSSVKAALGGEKSMRLLYEALDVSKPEWLEWNMHKPDNYIDPITENLTNQIWSICNERNIEFDITPYYMGVASASIDREKDAYYLNSDGDEVHYSQKTYKITFTDGRTELCDKQQASLIIWDCERYGLPCPIRNLYEIK